jgi:hypothetical protein
VCEVTQPGPNGRSRLRRRRHFAPAFRLRMMAAWIRSAQVVIIDGQFQWPRLMSLIELAKPSANDPGLLAKLDLAPAVRDGVVMLANDHELRSKLLAGFTSQVDSPPTLMKPKSARALPLKEPFIDVTLAGLTEHSANRSSTALAPISFRLPALCTCACASRCWVDVRNVGLT